MGLRNIFNFAKARNVWNGVRRGVSAVYSPIKKISHGASSVFNFVDGLLDKAPSVGVPATLVNLVRDNPIYSGVKDVIEFADDLIEKDLPALGNVVEQFVEHNVFNPTGSTLPSGPSLGDVRQAGQQVAQRIAQRPSLGFTPNRGATSRQNVTGAAVA